MQLPAVMCFIAVLSEAEGLSSIPDLLRVFIYVWCWAFSSAIFCIYGYGHVIFLLWAVDDG